MTTIFGGQRLLAGFGDADSVVVGDYVEFSIIWDSVDSAAAMPGWDQINQVADYHIPGSDTNIVFLMGLGPITRIFTVLCDDKVAFGYLTALQQTTGTLRVPAAMNELTAATEVDYAGDVVADISEVVLRELTSIRVWTDGSVSALAAFWRSARS